MTDHNATIVVNIAGESPSTSSSKFSWSTLLDYKHLRREFIAGGLAGSVGIFIGFPLDLVKVNLQVYPEKYATARHAFSEMLQKDGVRGLYRGCIPPIVSQGIINSLMFIGESTAMRVLEPNLRRGESGKSYNSALAGCVGGLLQCVALVPSEVIKCRMQTNALSTASSVAANPWSQTMLCIRQVYAESGLFGFYKGLGATALREAPSISVYFFSYKSLRDHLTQLKGESAPSVSSIVLSGGIAGALSWAVVYPADVLKTHAQTNNPNGWSLLRLGQELVRTHGVRVLFRGLSATVVRAFPVNASTFVCYESLKDRLHLDD